VSSTSFKEKINDLKQSYPQISNNSKHNEMEESLIPLPPATPHTITTTKTQEKNNTTPKELEGVRNAIIALNNEYTGSLIDGLDVVEFWKKLRSS
jgi:hypothetical protein